MSASRVTAERVLLVSLLLSCVFAPGRNERHLRDQRRRDGSRYG